MSADAAPAPLSKVDSAVQGLSSSPPKEDKAAKRRQSSAAASGVFNIKDLGTYSFKPTFIEIDTDVNQCRGGRNKD
jgi:hypothetical protein